MFVPSNKAHMHFCPNFMRAGIERACLGPKCMAWREVEGARGEQTGETYGWCAQFEMPSVFRPETRSYEEDAAFLE